MFVALCHTRAACVRLPVGDALASCDKHAAAQDSYQAALRHASAGSCDSSVIEAVKLRLARGSGGSIVPAAPAVAPTLAVSQAATRVVPPVVPEAAIAPRVPSSSLDALPARTTIAAGPAARRKKKVDLARKTIEAPAAVPTAEEPMDLDAEELACARVLRLVFDMQLPIP